MGGKNYFGRFAPRFYISDQLQSWFCSFIKYLTYFVKILFGEKSIQRIPSIVWGAYFFFHFWET